MPEQEFIAADALTNQEELFEINIEFLSWVSNERVELSDLRADDIFGMGSSRFHACRRFMRRALRAKGVASSQSERRRANARRPCHACFANDGPSPAHRIFCPYKKDRPC
jgi:hypothetical protein